MKKHHLRSMEQAATRIKARLEGLTVDEREALLIRLASSLDCCAESNRLNGEWWRKRFWRLRYRCQQFRGWRGLWAAMRRFRRPKNIYQDW